jgi:hypothetical protein
MDFNFAASQFRAFQFQADPSLALRMKNRSLRLRRIGAFSFSIFYLPFSTSRRSSVALSPSF